MHGGSQAAAVVEASVVELEVELSSVPEASRPPEVVPVDPVDPSLTGPGPEESN